MTYSVTDAGANTNTVTRTVTVQDTTAPSLTLIGDSNFTHNLNTAWVDPGYDANDTLDGNLTASVSISGTVDVNTTGTYTLNYSVLDTAGNQADINRTVNVAPMGPWTFTNAGATGRFGPTQAQIDANYSGTSLEGAVTINATHQGIQEWTVPATGTYTIEVHGAEGGYPTNYLGMSGKGARMKGEFQLNKSVVLEILVGQEGSSSTHDGTGGGGTFVSHNNNTPIIVAGGGGGGSSSSSGGNGLTGTSGGASSDGAQGGGGSNAQGGTASSNAASGAGFTGNSQPGSHQSHLGYSFVNGGNGGHGQYRNDFDGGFGGGGSSHGGGWGGGGGGGYSGGGAYNWGYGGGGGGSFNSGTNQDNQAGVNEGHGKVIITYIGN